MPKYLPPEIRQLNNEIKELKAKVKTIKKKIADIREKRKDGSNEVIKMNMTKNNNLILRFD